MQMNSYKMQMIFHDTGVQAAIGLNLSESLIQQTDVRACGTAFCACPCNTYPQSGEYWV